MSAVPFSWMYQDPALIADRLINQTERLAKAEAIEKERHRIRQARKWRKLVKLAKSRNLKGQA